MATASALKSASQIFASNAIHQETSFLNSTWAYADEASLVAPLAQLATEFPGTNVYAFAIRDFDRLTQAYLKQLYKETSAGAVGAAEFVATHTVMIVTGNRNGHNRPIINILFQ